MTSDSVPIANLIGLAKLCSAAVAESDVASVTIVVAGRQNREGAVSHSDAGAAQAHALEFTLGEGPTTDALSAGIMTLACELTTASERWPQFVPAAQRLGIKCVSAVPLRMDRMLLGSLTFYAHDSIAADRLRQMDAFAIGASVVATLLNNSDVVNIDIETIDVTDGSVIYRAVVHQATGMIAAQLRCDMDDALLRLRAYAFAQNESVEQIARAVVERRMKVSL